MSNEFFLPSETEPKTAPKEKYSGPDFALPSEEGKPTVYGPMGDLGMGAAAGASRGVLGIPGIVGDLRDLVDVGVRKAGSYAGSYLTGKPQEEIEQRMMEAAKEAESRKLVPSAISFAPTSAQTIKAAETVAPQIKGVTQYEPTTSPGRIAKDTMEMVGGAAVGPGGMASKLAIGAGGGLTGASAKELFRGSSLELPAQLAGTLAGGLAGGVAQGRYALTRPAAVQERAERVAGQVLRESVDDPQAVQAALRAERAAAQADPERYLQGVDLTSAQAARSGQLANLERQLAQLDPASTEAIALQQQIERSRQALGTEAARAPGMVGAGIRQPDMAQAIGLQGVNPQGEASRAARAAIDALEKQKDEAAKLAWQNPLISQAAVYRNKAATQLDDYLQSLTPTDRSRLSPEVLQRINALMTEGGAKTVPLLELQAIRSLVLDEARGAFGQGKGSLGMIHQKLGSKIADVINDPSNIRFGDRTGQSRGAWQQAVAATKDYYDTFRPEFMAKLVEESAGGIPKIGSDAVFGAMYSGRNAVENLKQVRNTFGAALDSDISNWMVGQLTQNGSKVKLSQADVNRFLADPKNAAFAQEVPGLRDRLTDLARKAGESEQAAALRQLNTNFEAAINSGNPDRLANFLRANGTELKATLGTPQEKKFIDAIGRSAQAMERLPSYTTNPSETLARLQNGRIMDIVYGRSIGRISDVVAAELAARVASAMAGYPGATDFLGAAVGALGTGRVTGPIAERIGQFMLGDTRNISIQQLQIAARDPEVMMLLMQKPSPEVVARLQEKIAGLVGAMSYERSLDQPREQRASGGKVSSSSIGARLVAAADRAKKEINKSTEPLLQSDDESIAKALEIANKHI